MPVAPVVEMSTPGCCGAAHLQMSCSNSMAEHSYDKSKLEVASSSKKDSFFGVDTQERVEKFLSKLTKMLHKLVYGEKKTKCYSGDE